MRRRRKQEKRRIGLGRRAEEGRRSRGAARRLRWLALLAFLAVCGLVAALAAFLAFGAGSSEPPGPPTAAIVDQLALTFPNLDFLQAATDTLEEVGYAVDYYPGEEVSVDFYRDLPTRGYDYLVLRVHSAGILHERGGRTSTDKPFLFTAEPYEGTKHVEDQMAGNLAGVHYSEDDPVYLFGIGGGFIRSSMKGDFDGATVILMGCDALKSDTAASAFVDKGAGVVIGWDGGVSASHTDAATERLLHHLLIDKLGIQEAVARTMTEIGPDPSYGSKLLVYPPEASASAPH